MRAAASRRKIWTHRSVLELIRSDGRTTDPEQIIRWRARALVEEVGNAWEGPPFDLEILASLRGYRVEEVEFLAADQDACITLDRMLVNSRKPRARRRFSVGHEIGHTLFPDFEREVDRGGPRWRRRRDSQSQVEILCQIAASELLMPVGPFEEAMRQYGRPTEAVFGLADLFEASFEAVARRIVDLSRTEMAAVFLSMKHKPIEKAQLQQIAFDLPDFHNAPSVKLRIDYAVTSPACGALFLPPDKSIPDRSVAYDVWHRCAGGARVPTAGRAEEDWGDVGGIGVCVVDSVAIPARAGVTPSILCFLHPC